MEFTRAELKEQAKAQLKGNVWKFFLVTLIMSIILGFAGAVVAAVLGRIDISLISTGSSILQIFVVPPFTVGLLKVVLNMTYGDEPRIETIFEPFKTIYWKTVGLSLMIGILVTLWSLLFLIPGIIKGLSYSQAFYILLENPDKGVMECIDESKQIMNGRKWDLFVLQLSFILWIFLVMITLGIAMIYVQPYMLLTQTNFYHRIKNGAGNNVSDCSSFDNVAETVETVSETIE